MAVQATGALLLPEIFVAHLASEVAHKGHQLVLLVAPHGVIVGLDAFEAEIVPWAVAFPGNLVLDRSLAIVARALIVESVNIQLVLVWAQRNEAEEFRRLLRKLVFIFRLQLLQK